MNNFVIGQEVVVATSTGGWYSRPYKIETVTRVLKNQVELSGGKKYSLKTLKELSQYSSTYLQIDYDTNDLMTVEKAKQRNTEIELEVYIKKTANKISAFNWKQSSLEDIKLIEDIMNRYENNE